jgi:hypothetical protein
MAYPSSSTFVTFPNGDTIDVAGLTQSVSGKSLMLKNPAGSMAYQFNFGSQGDAQSFSNQIATVVSSFNANPITYYLWSTDGADWQAGPIPVNASPIFIQLNGQNIGSAESSIITDFDGNEFNVTAQAASTATVLVGPFAAPGSNSPVIGSAKLVLYNTSGIATGSTVIVIGPQQVLGWTPASESTLVEWLKADVGLSSPVSSWTASFGSPATASGTARPTLVPGAVNGLPIVRFDGVANAMGTASLSVAQTFTLSIAFRFQGPGGGSQYVLSDQSGVAATYVGENGGELQAGAGGSVMNIAPADTNFHILFIVFKADSSQWGLDGGPLIAGPTSTDGLPSLALGYYASNNDNFAQSDIGEVVIWSGDGTMFYDDLVEYMMNRWF